MIGPGTHITALGADQPGKAELSADLLRLSLFVCDDLDLANTMGAAGGAGVGAEVFDADLVKSSPGCIYARPVSVSVPLERQLSRIEDRDGCGLEQVIDCFAVHQLGADQPGKRRPGFWTIL
jgi:hypothetical protein